ncbi:uncharacterized protein BJ171DRAFT_495557 [Polychytrium aggregatum]|uniref:uncharacterized protein n=1 Tax=Polychytrium aggregatum TaxID=110093 RepID=UPI0022FECA47|nr:uncharacterized protein BJ171DRAFT_495557 [Polychytrium aggregatum]KAI9207061.1 hypothetical protein BJ171DRAFT_495557 [Polychytrium aggregatum]
MLCIPMGRAAHNPPAFLSGNAGHASPRSADMSSPAPPGAVTAGVAAQPSPRRLSNAQDSSHRALAGSVSPSYLHHSNRANSCPGSFNSSFDTGPPPATLKASKSFNSLSIEAIPEAAGPMHPGLRRASSNLNNNLDSNLPVAPDDGAMAMTRQPGADPADREGAVLLYDPHDSVFADNDIDDDLIIESMSQLERDGAIPHAGASWIVDTERALVFEQPLPINNRHGSFVTGLPQPTNSKTGMTVQPKPEPKREIKQQTKDMAGTLVKAPLFNNPDPGKRLKKNPKRELDSKTKPSTATLFSDAESNSQRQLMIRTQSYNKDAKNRKVDAAHHTDLIGFPSERTFGVDILPDEAGYRVINQPKKRKLDGKLPFPPTSSHGADMSVQRAKLKNKVLDQELINPSCATVVPSTDIGPQHSPKISKTNVSAEANAVPKRGHITPTSELMPRHIRFALSVISPIGSMTTGYEPDRESALLSYLVGQSTHAGSSESVPADYKLHAIRFVKTLSTISRYSGAKLTTLLPALIPLITFAYQSHLHEPLLFFIQTLKQLLQACSSVRMWVVERIALDQATQDTPCSIASTIRNMVDQLWCRESKQQRDKDGLHGIVEDLMAILKILAAESAFFSVDERHRLLIPVQSIRDLTHPKQPLFVLAPSLEWISLLAKYPVVLQDLMGTDSQLLLKLLGRAQVENDTADPQRIRFKKAVLSLAHSALESHSHIDDPTQLQGEVLVHLVSLLQREHTDLVQSGSTGGSVVLEMVQLFHTLAAARRLDAFVIGRSSHVYALISIMGRIVGETEEHRHLPSATVELAREVLDQIAHGEWESIAQTVFPEAMIITHSQSIQLPI